MEIPGQFSAEINTEGQSALNLPDNGHSLKRRGVWLPSGAICL
jgi:hypothetical protein